MTRGPRTAEWQTTAAFTALASAFFAPGLLLGQIPVFRDLLVLSIPLRAVAREAIRAGTIPLWTNDLFFGAPFLADYQSAVFYPPSAILYALPLAPGVSAFLAFHLLVAGWGMARFLERRSGVGRGEALFGGVVFAFGGFMISLVPLTNQLVVASWMPWTLSSSEELAERPGHGSFLRLTLFLVLQLLGGGVEMLLLTLALVAVSALRDLAKGSARPLACLASAAAGLLAVALCAAQLLPTAEYAGQTDRAGGLPYERVVAESVAPRSLTQLAFPHTFSGKTPSFVPEGSVPLFWSFYLGVVPLVLAALSAIRRPFGFWPIVAGVALLMAFGDHSPVFPAAYALAPSLFGAFRFPGKFFAVTHFALTVLATHGLAKTLRDPRSGALVVLGLGTIATVAVAGALAARLTPGDFLNLCGYSTATRLGDSAKALLASSVAAVALRTAAMSAGAAIVVWLLGRGAIASRVALVVVGALTAVDLFTVHQPSLVYTDWQSLHRSGLAAAGDDRGERIFHFLPNVGPGLAAWNGFLRPGEDAEEQARASWAALVPDAPIVYGLGAVAGSDGFATRAQQDFFRVLANVPRERAVQLLAALGVGRLMSPERQSYALANRAPRSYLAERVFTARDRASALVQMTDPDFRPGHDAVVTASDDASPFSSGSGRLTIFESSATDITADVEVPGDTLWIVGDTLFPGWKATIDGRPAEIVPANGIVRGVRIPAGTHRVAMHYDPASFRLGCVLSMAAAVVLIVEGFAALRATRPA